MKNFQRYLHDLVFIVQMNCQPSPCKVLTHLCKILFQHYVAHKVLLTLLIDFAVSLFVFSLEFVIILLWIWQYSYV